MATTDGRVLLPAGVEPELYSISLDVDLDKFSFDGKESVDLQITVATTTISLHSKELYIKSASCTGSDGEKQAAVGFEFDLKLTLVKISFDKEVPVGAAKLQIEFEGCLNNKMAGFYRSSYSAVNGEKRIMASTQFEALDARRCFPCWDEPHRKAVFEVTLVVPADRTAFSNMPEAESHELAGGRRQIKFLPSPKMSTYLLAFCVGEFDFVQAQTKHGVLCKVYTPPGKSEKGLFALGVALKTLDLYDDMFKIPYPLPKLDMVAIPEFAMGAMENWGLVTYREADLLIDEKKTSAGQRQRVCTVVTHELAHQWFGNLVTMTWWDDLWLNEGFASWMETYAADYLFPEWKMWEQFSSNDRAAALRLDSLRSSHPIQVPIAHAEEVEEVFDAISYCKGACVVKMLYAVLGPDKFQEGLQLYMERHQYGNTETIDLWTAWEEVSKKPIRAIMASWTEQMGHPVIIVTGEEWSAGSVKLSLRQRWFLADGSEVAAGEEKTWKVPIQVATSSSEKQAEFVMEQETHELTVPLSNSEDWVSLGFGQHTLMRVHYTPEMLRRLEGAVSAKTLPPADRASLLSDAFALAKAGSMPVAEVLKLLPAYAGEDNCTVWEMLEMALLGLDKAMMEDEAMSARYCSFAARLVKPLVAAVGWEAKPEDGHLGKMLRGCMVRLLMAFSWKDPAVVTEARRRFDAHFADASDTTSLPSDYASPVYKIVLKSGGEAEYNKLLQLFDRCEGDEERRRVYGSLGHAQQPALKLRTLEWGLEEVKLQDFMYPFGGVAGSGKAGLELTWRFYQDNFDRFMKKLAGSSPSLTNAIISSCSGGFADPAKIAEVEAFYKAHPLPNNQRKISQVLESCRIQSRFLQSMAASPLTTDEFWGEIGQKLPA